MRITALIICFVCISCNTRHINNDLDNLFYGIEDSISYSTCLTNEFLWGMPVKAHYIDSTLIVWEDAGDSLFVLIDPYNKEVIGKYGNRGQGVNEFLQPFSFQTINDSVAAVYDLWKHTLVELNLRNMINGNINYSVLLKDSLNCSHLIPTAEGNFIGLGIFEDCMYKLMDNKGHEIKSFYEYPYKDDTEEKINGRARAMAYQGTFHSNPSKNKAVYAVNSAPIVFFYKIDEGNFIEVKKYIWGFPSYKPEITDNSTSVVTSKDDKRGFVDAYATDKYVYLAYSGKSYRDFDLKAYSADILYVFDWEGNPVRKYYLNTDITCLCVSDNDDMMYAFSKIPEPTLIVFNLVNK